VVISLFSLPAYGVPLIAISVTMRTLSHTHPQNPIGDISDTNMFVKKYSSQLTIDLHTPANRAGIQHPS
jgi:hypothetical protein